MTDSATAATFTGGGRPPLSEERRQLIAEWLVKEGAVTVTELQEHFAVSPMTARRDLDELECRGVVRRTHGGAVLPSIIAGEHSFRQRLATAPEAKARLAEGAIALVAPGDTLFLDASSTTYFLARLIAQRALKVRVITNSLPVLQELADGEAEVIAIGGTFRRLTHSYVGPGAVRSVREHFADHLFLSVTGVSRTGVMIDADLLEAEVKRTMLEQATQATLLVDGSKISARGRQAVARVDRLTLILGDGLSCEDEQRLRAFTSVRA